MPRPCAKRHPEPRDGCHLCWLYLTNHRYNRLWGGDGQVAGAVRATARVVPCRHRGAEVRRQDCATCAGKVLLKVFACAVHGECTIGRQHDATACCATCPDYQTETTVTVQTIPVDVVTLMCGRTAAWPHYLRSLRGLDYPRQLLRVTWYTNSQDATFVEAAEAEAGRLRAEGLDVRLTVDPTVPLSRIALREMRPGDAPPIDQADVIAELYNRAVEPTDRDLFFLEDDCGAPPDALRRLQVAALAAGAGLACGVVRCRHSNQPWVWNLLRGPRGWKVQAPGHKIGVHPIGIGGYVCAYLPRAQLDLLSRPWFKARAPADWGAPWIGADMVMCVEMERLGIPRVCDFDFRPAHYDSQGRPH